MQDESARVFGELGADRRRAGSHRVPVGVDGRRGHIHDVLPPRLHTRCGARDRIDELGHLKVVDVHVDRMGVIVEVGEFPLLHRIHARLDQLDVRERVVVDLVQERLGIVLAGPRIVEATAELELTCHIGCHHRGVDKRRVGVQVLARVECCGLALPGVGRDVQQGLRREGEKAVSVAEVGRVDGHRPQDRR